MTGGSRKPSPARRGLRLSPLEMMILGLIVVGVLYLISIWIIGGRSGETPQPPAAPQSLLERALAASEKVQAQLASQDKELAQAMKKVDRVMKELDAAPRGKGAPRLARRLARLEKKLAKIASAGKPAPANAKLAARVEALEKKQARLARQTGPSHDTATRLAALTKRLDKLTKRLDKQDKALAAQSQGSTAALELRLARLEKIAARPAKAPAAGDTARLNQRLDEVEKKLAQAKLAAALYRPPSASLSAFEQRLKRLEQILDRIKGAAATSADRASSSLSQMDRRLRSLELALAQNGKTGGGGAIPAQFEARLRRLEKNLHTVRAPVPNPNIVARLEKLEKERARPAPSGDSAKLISRLARLEKQVASLSRSPARRTLGATKNSPRPKLTRVRYKVRRGDTLLGIARRYKVRASDIKKWNPKLKRRRNLWIGEKLTIYRGG